MATPSTPHRVALFGATSAIAEALARRYAAGGAELFLVGRRPDQLTRIADDLKVRGASKTTIAEADLADSKTHAEVVAAVASALPDPDAVILAWGTLTDQAKAEEDAVYARSELETNFVAPALLLLQLARWLESRNRGVVAVITSVAGDRGRQSNFVYGAAKGGLQSFLEGLRHRLHRQGIAVLDIRPGFVATPMTQHLDQKGPLWATPDRVAADIERAIALHRDVLYTPWFWRWIMLIVRSMPRPIFHRSKL